MRVLILGVRVRFDGASRYSLAWLNRLVMPATREQESAAPHERALAIASAAGRNAAVLSAALSLPPGPIGWITVPVELVTVWRIQAQMIADIAGAYGRASTLSHARVMRCLFRGVLRQLARDAAVRASQRVLVERLALRAIESGLCRIGASIGRRTIARGATRFLPLLGAGAAACCTRLDTHQVAAAAIALFGSDADDPDRA